MTRLKINKYRKVEPGCTLELGRGNVFLIGPNGSGKSTLLRLMACLLTGDLDELCGSRSTPVDVEWTLEAEDPSRSKAYRYEFRLMVELRDSHDGEMSREPLFHRDWQLDCVFHRVGAAREGASTPVKLSIRDGKLVEYGAGEARKILRRIDSSMDLMHALSASVSAGILNKWDEELEGFLRPFGLPIMPGSVSKRGRFDEALEAYHAICGTNPEWSRATITARKVERLSLSGQFVPSSMLTSPDSELERRALESSIARSGTASMAATAALIGADSMWVEPRFLEQQNGTSISWRGFNIEVTWPGGVTHTHLDLSFGQKRLIAAIWYIGVFQNYPLLFDELANGMHARWVRDLTEIIGDQQAFHALQNPLLLDWIGPSEEDLRPQFVRCTVEVRDGQRVWTWRNPSDEEVERLEARWSSGLQNLSAILESEGWW